MITAEDERWSIRKFIEMRSCEFNFLFINLNISNKRAFVPREIVDRPEALKTSCKHRVAAYFIYTILSTATDRSLPLSTIAP